MKRLLLTSSLYAAVALMADGLASAGPAPDVPDPNLYHEIKPSTAKVKLGGEDHDVTATYAKQHEDAAGKTATTHLHVICHLGIFVLARTVEDQANPQADTHAIDPNVPAEIAGHLEHLNSQGSETALPPVDSRGVPAGTKAAVLPVAAPVSEFPPSPAPEPTIAGSGDAGGQASTDTDPNAGKGQGEGQSSDDEMKF